MDSEDSHSPDFLSTPLNGFNLLPTRDDEVPYQEDQTARLLNPTEVLHLTQGSEPGAPGGTWFPQAPESPEGMTGMDEGVQYAAFGDQTASSSTVPTEPYRQWDESSSSAFMAQQGMGLHSIDRASIEGSTATLMPGTQSLESDFAFSQLQPQSDPSAFRDIVYDEPTVGQLQQPPDRSQPRVTAHRASPMNAPYYVASATAIPPFNHPTNIQNGTFSGSGFRFDQHGIGNNEPWSIYRIVVPIVQEPSGEHYDMLQGSDSGNSLGTASDYLHPGSNANDGNTPLTSPALEPYDISEPGAALHATSPGESPRSTISITSSSVPTILPCPEETCGASFTGVHRKGNLGRHIRLKHRNGSVRTYPCEVPGCHRVYLRQDALLKHQRKHPELDMAGPVGRK